MPLDAGTLSKLFRRHRPERMAELLRPRSITEGPLPPPIPRDADASGRDTRMALLSGQGHRLVDLTDPVAAYDAEAVRGNVENYLGVARVPVGIAGPLRVNGTEARGDYYVPLATTEGALVASYNRGAKVVSQSGGVSVVCVAERVQRAPGFQFADMAEAARFIEFALVHVDQMRDVVATTTRHGTLIDVGVSWDADTVVLLLCFETGEAAGQNIVTLAADAVARRLVQESPVKPIHWSVEANLFGEKKANHLALTGVRGKKVLAEAIIAAALVEKELNTTVAICTRFWRLWVTTGIESGSIGVQGHCANGLAALFLACGQDVAAVAEAVVGWTRVETTASGDLRLSVNLPNVIVGTVGGGTALPTQRDCLSLLDCHGPGSARKFAEICGALVLAGELSAITAMASGDFAGAHARLARKRQ
jgi:hydroxymethylglutaryl-CoA reductase (NADPH)